jgi:hypothetical protein
VESGASVPVEITGNFEENEDGTSKEKHIQAALYNRRL